RRAVRIGPAARPRHHPRPRRPRDGRRAVPPREGRPIMTTLRVLIVDDEMVARRRIRRLLATEADVTIVGDCEDGASALAAIAAEKPDIAFLDVQMPELDGFDVVRSIAVAELPAIVFVTAYDQYALQAFDVHAIDYLLKPFTKERFRTALLRARERLLGRSRH